MDTFLKPLLDFLTRHDGTNDKDELTKLAIKEFALTRDRKVYVCEDFAIRFSSAHSESFSNTVASLSKVQKYDDRPFIVCVVTPTKNIPLLANSTLLKKISHSSQKLRQDNIRGSFNGSDIVRELVGIPNTSSNFRELFLIHQGIEFETNLVRLVEATNNISPTGKKYQVTAAAQKHIDAAPERAQAFVSSEEARVLKTELDEKVNQFRNEILLAALIENVNVRGRVIEYLIAGEDEALRKELIAALQSGKKGLPQFKTENALGDYSREFERFLTETDVKTKIMVLDSNPKAYNLDKILEFLSIPRTVFMFYFVGVDPTKIANTVLVSMFQTDLLNATIVLRHWAGRNSRGVTQFEGKTIGKLLADPSTEIDSEKARLFLEKIVAL